MQGTGTLDGTLIHHEASRIYNLEPIQLQGILFHQCLWVVKLYSFIYSFIWCSQMISSVTASKTLLRASKKRSSKNVVKPTIKAVNEPLSSINWEIAHALIYVFSISLSKLIPKSTLVLICIIDMILNFGNHYTIIKKNVSSCSFSR